jgi:DNA-binding transcriptional LysR family regulator
MVAALAWQVLLNEFMPTMKIIHTPEPFDARQLRILTALAHDRSLSAAARRLNLTQSAISHALKKLEEDAGTRLVERNERGAELTQAGQALARHANAIFASMKSARDELRRLKHWGTQRLRFGASSTACQYLLPQVLGAFAAKHPRCRIEVSAGDTKSRISSLREGLIDIALITHTGMSLTELELTDIFEEDLCLVRPANQRRNDELPFIGYHSASSLSQDALLWFDYNQLPRPHATMELESLEAIKSMVQLGLGHAVLPRWVVEKERAASTLTLTPGNKRVTRKWSLALRRGHQPTLCETTWLACAAAGAAKLGAV